ncbi:MAG: substrate-binding domain-containing protein [Nitrospirae bacterium]|nr:substrate-binding domain-containing protein [Nitrospirota bacterium]
MFNKYLAIMILVISMCLMLADCSKGPDKLPKSNGQVLRLGTSTTTMKSGLMDRIIPVFEKKYGIKVDISMAGSVETLNSARAGKVDVVFVHSREDEDKFVSEGYGINRKDVMYNDFVILGPPDDPIHIKGENNVLKAFQAIHDSHATFVSRGDKSGTYSREMIIWKLLNIKPSGNWYITANKNILEALIAASNHKAYVLADRGTYLYHKEELNLVIVVEGDSRLFNPYGVIAVNPIKVSGINYDGAMKFLDFITSIDGQEIICGYGKVKFNRSLFVPMAIKISLCQ